ncbi:alpha/beta hydrolase family protein [Candidatus Contubernalis alkaliaceticus]|uniref:alpha/beta hydrolase family protein n=1 Tax=Candidatus Contubernalis alkaliaceticus TaxID=338645 RepID=UPI001F4BD28F|nr:alpha/beta hydrolase [Candidatus Contubernalis alkalaceticus]UNC92216.1 alpha/beta hydrolase [Candidatus Contubernalis alkalaceticus]
MKKNHLTIFLIIIITSFLVLGCSNTDEAIMEPQNIIDETNEEIIEEVKEETKAEEEKKEEENTEVSTEPEDVTFITDDGLTIHGMLFGKGETGVILAHMFPSDQSSWYDVAVILASKGYQVLTFDFRGYGNSEGEKEIALIHRDVDAAWNFMKGKGIDKVVLIGASMGGTASMKVAAQRPAAGVVAISAPTDFRGLSAKDEVFQIKAPKLILASEGDNAAVISAEEFFVLANEPKEIKIFSGKAHGTDMLQDQQGTEVLEEILGFVDQINESM